MKQYKIALAGNPNSGKTTLFNSLTGSAQYVGNWPGVTVEKKEGKLKGHKDVTIQDLPGIYSLSPYTLEEVVARNYLINESPDAIINIIDGTNIERNLYLTTQLLELNIPMVVAINMIDLVERNKDRIDLKELEYRLGCPVYAISALKNNGINEIMQSAVTLSKQSEKVMYTHHYQGALEHTLAHIEDIISPLVDEKQLRWTAIKVFERDEKILALLKLNKAQHDEIEANIVACEKDLDDDGESIVTNQRYVWVSDIISKAVVKANQHALSISDRIDKIVTNRFLALPIFALVMIFVYYVAVTTIGTQATDWTNDVFFAEWIIPGARSIFNQLSTAPWLSGLIVDGIINGVGAVLGFVPQMVILFLMLSVLEDCGYMTRVAFIMDRIFRKFGLSGKSFIPMLIGSGCAVPGIMASRTIEQIRDRRMTIMTTSFIPCSAKLPIIALIAGALFHGAWWVAPLAYFIGVFAIIVSGIMLKKTRFFAGRPAPFVMELPTYHIPAYTNVLRSTWERSWSFVRRAGTVILLSSIVLWFLQAFGIVNGSFVMVDDNNHSLLAYLGRFIAPLFAPLGFGTWQASVGTITGLIAKENVVSTFGVLYGFAEVAESGNEFWTLFAKDFTALSAFSFMIFNLLCAPCFAAMGAIKREMNDAKWTWFAIIYLCVFAYCISFIVFQLGNFIIGGKFGIFTIMALLLLAYMLYMLVRNPKAVEDDND